MERHSSERILKWYKTRPKSPAMGGKNKTSANKLDKIGPG